MLFKILISASLAVLLAGSISSAGQEFMNPYFKEPGWKVWRLDPAPVRIDRETIISAPAKADRLYPRDVASKGNPDLFLRFAPGPDPAGKYAGIWDDAYSSRDKGHSYIRNSWSDAQGNKVSGLKKSLIHLKGGQPHKLGINFTSQSTTGMGHDIVNNAKAMAQTERFFYFADVLVSGPAHVSYMEINEKRAKDRYQALQPVFFNSVGSSGSETHALTKMIIAGGYLDPKLKARLKQNGLYPSAMLYIWKAALPYDVPFEHELKHRVAYFSLGDGSSYNRKGNTSPKVAREAYFYDDSAHMRNMIEIARALQAPPPEVILTVVKDEGCTPIYYLKKTVLVHSKPFKLVKLRVSLEDSYDLDGRPLNFRLKVLCGEAHTTIEQVEGKPVYDITVPYSLKLPQGRTSIIVVANNGLTDGNPAIINIYRTHGKPNQRPRIKGLKDVNAVPGQEVRLKLSGRDPEWFPVRFYKALGPGRIMGGEFVWQVPKNHPGGVETVVVIASDNTAGNSYNTVNATITVRKN